MVPNLKYDCNKILAMNYLESPLLKNKLRRTKIDFNYHLHRHKCEKMSIGYSKEKNRSAHNFFDILSLMWSKVNCVLVFLALGIYGGVCVYNSCGPLQCVIQTASTN